MIGHAHPKPLQIAASPRSSVSVETSQSPRTPASPFLHNLHHRFRKGSNASSMSSDAAGSHAMPAPPSPSDRTETAQSAKRFLLSIVRNDWDYPLAASEQNVTEESLKKDEILAAREPTSWQTRRETQSDLDMDSDASNKYARRKRKSSDPYRFENPDAIAANMTQRKLKRRKKIEVEMQWNEGLRLWDARRDAWTGAVGHGVPGRALTGLHQSESMVPEAQLAEEPLVNGSLPDSQARSTAVATTNGDSQSGWPLPPPTESNGASAMLSAATTAQTDNQIPLEPVSSTLVPLSDRAPTEEELNGPYLPIYPPLFPTSHTLRSRIKPAAYPTIYSKVVLQSLTPNVPIPLTHMIGALVDGWKSEGNWPPQNAAEQQAQLSRKNVRKGETAFGRWKREQDEKKKLMKRNGEASNAALEEFEEHGKKGFRRSFTGAVKKVFGMHGDDEDADGGLEKLGITFSQNEDNMDEALMIEDTRPVTETYVHDQP